MKKIKLSNNFLQLPTEIICNILLFAWDKDRRRYRRISKIFDSSYKFTFFTFIDEIKDFCTTFYTKNSQFNFDLIKKLNLYNIKKIRFYHYVYITDLMVILHYFKNLKEIVFYDHVNINIRTKNLIKNDPDIKQIAYERFSKLDKVYSKSKLPKIFSTCEIKVIEQIPCFYCDKVIERRPSNCVKCNKTFCKNCKILCLDTKRNCLGCRKRFFSKCKKCKSKSRVIECKHCLYSFCSNHSRICKICKKKKCLKCFDKKIKEYCKKCVKKRMK